VDPLLRPVGREPPATYWRRRALLLVAVLLALFAGSRACAGDGSGGGDGALRRGTGVSLAGPGNAEPTSTATPSGGPGSTSEPTGEPSGGSGQPTGQPTDESTGIVAGGGVVPGYCQDGNIKVSVKPTRSTFPPTQDATFRLSIVNVGSGPCRYEVGPRGWEATAESGTTRIWNSDDCAVAEASRLRTLQPDEPVTVTIVWDRIRSKQGCPSGQPAAAAGTYTLIAKAGNVSSQKVSFVLAD
jgi:hypothetical protein